ncbi:MAG: fibronectin type III domain-containing protein [Elusimicrobia bacterium]|nr:fibronectin type III domain-containing protein [Elusimicrobiota bacterium]
MSRGLGRLMAPPARTALLASLLGWAIALPPALLHAAEPPPPSDSLTITFTPRDVWPPAPVQDLAASPGAEGQLLLEWTAPDSNGDLVPQKTAVAGYTVRIATFSADSVGSTTTWWNMAQDVNGEPMPAFPGTPQSLLLNGLEPGSTFYAAILSSDYSANVSTIDVHAGTPGQQAFALVFDAVPPAPTDLSAVAVNASTIRVTWTAPAGPDLDFYRLYIDQTDPYDFADTSVVAVDLSTDTYMHTMLGPGTYYYRIAVVDKGAPDWRGHALESAPSSFSSETIRLVVRPPQAPFGIDIATNPSGARIDWLPVRRYDDLTPFADPLAPGPQELSGYQVYRATAATHVDWTSMISLSTDTLTWTDPAGGPEYCYSVKALNGTGASPRSMARCSADESAWVSTPDDSSSLLIPLQWVKALMGAPGQPDTAYLVKVSSAPCDPASGVMKDIRFATYRGGALVDPALRLDGLATLTLHYQTGTSSVVPSGLDVAAPAPQPGNLSVFWFNGSKWLQLYGKLDSIDRVMVVETRFFGEYQLRLAARANSFTFNPAGITNRFITPNGDGKNDNVVFFFDNPAAAEVVGKIFDSRGRLVVGALPVGPAPNSLIWDGSANGAPVASGPYIYQIQADNKTFTGTVYVIK